MAEVTGIAWTDSTFNPWIGCTKVSPGCDHCYAEAMDKRHRWGGATHWGPWVPRKRTSEAYWKQPLTWNRKAEASGKRHLVFCASLADVFDNEVDARWRGDLFRLIERTHNLTWLLLTKRIGNAVRFMPWGEIHMPPNVWIGASVVNQEEADRDIPKLLATPAAKHFVSYEPGLGPIDFTRISLGKAPMRVANSGDHNQQFREMEFTINALKGAKSINWPALDWIIVGGESTQGAPARPFDVNWAVDTIRQCKAAGVPVFVKQLGGNPFSGEPHTSVGKELVAIMENRPGWRLKDRAGADPAEWPEDLRVQEFPT